MPKSKDAAVTIRVSGEEPQRAVPLDEGGDEVVMLEPSELSEINKEDPELNEMFDQIEKLSRGETVEEAEPGEATPEQKEKPVEPESAEEKKKEQTPETEPQQQVTADLSEAEQEHLKALTPKLLQKYPGLQKLFGKEVNDINHILAAASQDNMVMQQLRALSGRMNQSVPDFLNTMQNAVMGYFNDRTGQQQQVQPHQAQPQVDDSQKYEKVAGILGVTVEQAKEIESLYGPRQPQIDPQIMQQMQQLQQEVQGLRSVNADAYKERLWNDFAGSPQTKEIANKLGRPALEQILSNQEALVPGTINSLIRRGINPYGQAAFYSADPTVFMQVRGFVPKTQEQAPPVTKQASAQAPAPHGNKSPEEMSDEELFAAIDAAGGRGFTTKSSEQF